MYQTTFLPDAVFLLAKDCRLTGIHPNCAGFATFAFDVCAEDAAVLLASEDARLCRKYHQAWRDVRRQLDRAQATAHTPARIT